MSVADVLRRARALEIAADDVLVAWFAFSESTDESIARLDAAMTALEDLREAGRPAASHPAEDPPADPPTPEPTPAPATPASPSAKVSRRSGPSPEGQTGGRRPAVIGTKTCSSCNVDKPITAFDDDGRTKDRRTKDCTDCRRGSQPSPVDVPVRRREPIDREAIRRRIAEVRDSDPAEAKRLTEELAASAKELG